MEGKLGEYHSGELRREAEEAKCERIVAEELARLRWKESDLAARRKSDPADWRSRPGCVGKRRCRSRVLRLGWAWARPRAPMPGYTGPCAVKPRSMPAKASLGYENRTMLWFDPNGS